MSTSLLSAWPVELSRCNFATKHKNLRIWRSIIAIIRRKFALFSKSADHLGSASAFLRILEFGEARWYNARSSSFFPRFTDKSKKRRKPFFPGPGEQIFAATCREKEIDRAKLRGDPRLFRSRDLSPSEFYLAHRLTYSLISVGPDDRKESDDREFIRTRGGCSHAERALRVYSRHLSINLVDVWTYFEKYNDKRF